MMDGYGMGFGGFGGFGMILGTVLVVLAIAVEIRVAQVIDMLRGGVAVLTLIGRRGRGRGGGFNEVGREVGGLRGHGAPI